MRQLQLTLTEEELARITIALSFYGAAIAADRAMLAELVAGFGERKSEVFAARDLVRKISRAMGLPEPEGLEPFG